MVAYFYKNFLKYSIVCNNHFSSSIFGSRQIISFASELSALLCFGSSIGKSLNIILLLVQGINLITISANSLIVNSNEVPIFTGQVNHLVLFIIFIIQSIRSSIY